jgi:hypothetical protein
MISFLQDNARNKSHLVVNAAGFSGHGQEACCDGIDEV